MATNYGCAAAEVDGKVLQLGKNVPAADWYLTGWDLLSESGREHL